MFLSLLNKIISTSLRLLPVLSILTLFTFLQGCKSTNKATKNSKFTPAPYSTMNEFKNFNHSNLDEAKLTDDEILFKNGLNQIAAYNFNAAKSTFMNIFSNSSNDTLKNQAAIIIYNILFYQSQWKELRKFDSIINKGVKDKDNIMILSQAFAESPQEKVDYKEDSTTVNWSSSPTGCPIVPCFINGKKRYFWFDTGANYSVISSDIADECDVFAISSSPSKALTATVRKINIYPAIADSLQFGNTIIYNSPFVIVHDFDLKLRLIGSKPKIKIDGIIGWKAIQHTDISIDFQNQTMTIRKPRDKQIPLERKNFFWLGCPVVLLQSEDNTPLIFGLDLGAASTCITHKIFQKIDYDKIYERVKPQASAGGSVYFDAKLLSHLNLNISGEKVSFFYIGTAYQIPNLFLNLDGILGSDFLQNSLVNLDIRNGIFEYKKIK